MRQIVTPNPNIPCKPGWCLAYVNEAFGVRKVYGTATASGEASTAKHRNYNFPAGVWIPVWFELANEPAGHVALMAPNGNVYSTSDLGNTPHLHPDLADLIRYYAYYGMPLTYLGWTEDVEGTPVVFGGDITAMSETITPLSEEDDMPTVNDLLYAPIPKYDVEGNEIGTTSLAEVTAWNEANFYRQRKLTIDAIRETVLGVLTTELTNVATGGTTSLGTEASWAAWNAKRNNDGGVDAGAIADAISKAIAAKLTADTVTK